VNLSDTPYGYKRIVPLERSVRLRLPAAGEAPTFCHTLHAIPLSAAEFPTALRDYPIAFVRRTGELSFTAMAILGMHEGQNLFVMADGKWDRRTYMPAYVRRYPFCLVAATGRTGEDSERMICVDPDAVDPDEGRPMFDESGEPLPHWATIERMLHDYEDDLALTRDMCNLFSRLNLLEPFTLRAELVGGFSMSMENLYRVNPQALLELHHGDLRDLLSKGYLDQIYAHFFSQDNFQRLLNRRSFFAAEPPASPKQYN
jgi:SapC